MSDSTTVEGKQEILIEVSKESIKSLVDVISNDSAVETKRWQIYCIIEKLKEAHKETNNIKSYEEVFGKHHVHNNKIL